MNGLIESRVSSVDIIKKMAGYVWPKDRKEIKQRVVVSLGLLVLAKIVNVSVPFIFKHTIDLLNNKGTVQLALDTPVAGAGTAIFCLVLGCKFDRPWLQLFCMTFPISLLPSLDRQMVSHVPGRRSSTS